LLGHDSLSPDFPKVNRVSQAKAYDKNSKEVKSSTVLNIKLFW